MMMKPSMENASSPHDEMAVPNAMMLTAMVTCQGWFASGERQAGKGSAATHRRGQLVQACCDQDDHGHHRRGSLQDLDERHRQVQIGQVAKAQRRSLVAQAPQRCRRRAAPAAAWRNMAREASCASGWVASPRRAHTMRKPSGKMRDK